MPVFAFEAIKKDGQKVKSEVTAESKDEAIRKIEDKGLHPTRIKAEKKSPFGSKKSGFKGKKTGGKFGGKPVESVLRAGPRRATTGRLQCASPGYLQERCSR